MCIFALKKGLHTMTLELNQVLIANEAQTFSLLARTGQLTCLTGGNAERRTRWLLAMMGFEPVRQGYISIEGEPLTTSTTDTFRRLIAYAPKRLESLGEVYSYEPPTVQDIFLLKANREQPISNGILGEEMRSIATAATDHSSVRLLAVASLLNKPILLVDTPLPAATAYLRQQAAKGKVVIVATNEKELLAESDNIAELT